MQTDSAALAERFRMGKKVKEYCFLLFSIKGLSSLCLSRC